MSQFAHGLHLIRVAAFSYLCAEIPLCIVLADDRDFWAFIAVTKTVLEVDTLFRSDATRARTVSRRAWKLKGSPTNQASSHHPSFLNGVDPADTTKFADAYHWQTLYEAEPNMGGTARRDIGAKNDADVARS